MCRQMTMKGLWAVALCLALSPAWADTQVNETKPAEADGNLSISNVAGKITVEGWDRNEIQVEGTLGDGVERLEFDVSGDSAEIEVKLPRRGNVRNGQANLTIRVPVATQLDVETVSASISVSGVRGEEMELETVAGTIRVANCAGAIEAETVSGSIEVEGVPSSVQAEAVSGRIEIRGVSREVYAETISGPIEVEAGTVEDFSASTVNGAITFTGGLLNDGDIDVETINGSVTLNLRAPAHGDYSIETFNGRIQCDFGPEPSKKSRFGPGWKLDFEHGDNGADIRVSSFNGRVMIKRID